MLLSLHVKNLALIDETEVNFDDGFNVLSGETGAGKSLIIGSINLALGDRAGKELIRNGAEYALVELIFAVTKPEQERVLKHLGIFGYFYGSIVVCTILTGVVISRLPLKKFKEIGRAHV